MAVSLRLLDTNAVIYIVGESVLQPPPNGPYAISVISEIELLGFHLLDERSELGLRTFLTAMQILPLTETIKERAISIRKLYRLKGTSKNAVPEGRVLSARHESGGKSRGNNGKSRRDECKAAFLEVPSRRPMRLWPQRHYPCPPTLLVMMPSWIASRDCVGFL
jgi:hypothetical protein